MSGHSTDLPTDPHHWEAAHVVAWIKTVKKESKNSQYLAKVKADRYKSFKGQVLCNLRKDIFLAFEPGVAGEVLYKDLHKRVQFATEMDRSSVDDLQLPRQSQDWEEPVTSKESKEYPLFPAPKPIPKGKDPIREAHLDPYKEEFLDIDEYVSVILEFGELPDPDHFFADTNRILHAIFNLMPPTGKNFSSQLEAIMPDLLQPPLFRAPMTYSENDDSSTEALKTGHICLVNQVDTVMGSLFRYHLCKGTRQAETVLHSAYELHPHIQALIHDDVHDVIRPPPVLLIPRTAPPSTSVKFQFDDKKRSSDCGYNSSDETKSSGKKEDGMPERKATLSKGPPSSASVHSEREKVPGWKAELSSFGIQLHAYSIADTLPLEWNPNLTVPFSVNGMQKGPVEQHEDRYISLEVENPWPFPIGISLRVFALSRPYNPEIVFPGPYSGVHVLQKQEVWKLNAELHYKQSEWCVLELLVCQVAPKQQWNVQRHAVVVKKKSKHPLLKRGPRLDPSKKAGNLKAIIGWCVYFVLNNSGSTMGASCADAKVILTQLLTLPDFHRPELRCFTVGCLAILAKVLFETTGENRFISCMMAFQKHSKELLAASRNTQNPRMINLCHLTERMLDTVDLEDIIRKRRPEEPKGDRVSQRFWSYKELPVGPLSTEQWIEVDVSVNSSANLYIPSHPLDSGSQIKLATVSCDEVIKQMRLDHLAAIVHPLCCIHISTSPQEVSLKRPFMLHISTLNESSPGSHLEYIVMKASDFKGPWTDSTESFNVETAVDETGVTKISVKSPLLGWIIPLSVEWRPSIIAQHAMNNLIKEEPVTIKTTVLISNPSHRSARNRHILVIFSAMNMKRSILRPPMDMIGRDYKQIGDQQMFQGVVGSQLKVELTGNFDPEKENDSLEQVFTVPDVNDEYTVEKWVVISDSESSELDLIGKLKVSDVKEGGRREEVLNVQLRASF